MTDPDLRAAGFVPECNPCREEVRHRREVRETQHVATQKRAKRRAYCCPPCSGTKHAIDNVCGRCRGAEVR